MRNPADLTDAELTWLLLCLLYQWQDAGGITQRSYESDLLDAAMNLMALKQNPPVRFNIVNFDRTEVVREAKLRYRKQMENILPDSED